jgi:hypothetical protein
LVRFCSGKDEEILKHRKAVYQQAKLRNPNRWSGEIRNWDKVEEVYLNPENQTKPLKWQQQMLSSKLRGHFQYFGVRCNMRSMEAVRHFVIRGWQYWLNYTQAKQTRKPSMDFEM